MQASVQFSHTLRILYNNNLLLITLSGLNDGLQSLNNCRCIDGLVTFLTFVTRNTAYNNSTTAQIRHAYGKALFCSCPTFLAFHSCRPFWPSQSTKIISHFQEKIKLFPALPKTNWPHSFPHQMPLPVHPGCPGTAFRPLTWKYTS